jgi:luciferase-like monooxygenase
VSSLFHFVVRHLRWLARIPGAPHLFDALLLAFTCVFSRPRTAAMELLERQALDLPGLRLRVHRLGGIGFIRADGREAGHVHGHGLLDVRLHPDRALSYVDRQLVGHHHVFPPKSGWVSLQLRSPADVGLAMELLAESL